MCQLAKGSKFKLLRALVAEMQPTLKIINSEKKHPSSPEGKALKAVVIKLRCELLELNGYVNFANLIKRKAINAGL